MTKISIIVNCYNGEEYLENCISSILKQKYQNFEIIFFDNCSSDKSKKIIRKFDDKRIKYYFSSKLIPLYKARNEAIKKATGSLIAFLDVDDWWDESYLSSKEIFFQNKKYDYFYSNVFCFYQKNNKRVKYYNYKLPNGRIYNFLAKNYLVIISGLIIKKKILVKENYFNETYNIIGDYDLLMRISKYCNAKSFNKPLIYYRVHNKNFSKQNNEMYFNEYNDWFQNQLRSNDKKFQQNKIFFLHNLIKLEIIYLLYKKKNFSLIIKILKYPQFLLKLKFLIAFFLPLKLINFFRK
jgi:teichuronic acid biosynthesis glycosyltransferase TuaG